ncbi:hypothetical protein EGW08_012715 [Elysia chlorotica]|uniref:ARID domain-containing protein n=1 Tax=Elysia chlorotica TaxID=188477 RepID=A0A433TD32_ELYCH|nr:hypothetical protein EGW08_012715 [Elysia chlorotica]
MVGRRNTLLVTKRSLRNADSTAGKRPKRIIPTKLMEETVGMSRQEEQELNKALYASLQENRRSKSMPSLVDHHDEYHSNDDSGLSNISNSSKNISSNNSRRSLPSGSKTGKLTVGQRRLLRTGAVSPLRHVKRTHKQLRTSNTPSPRKSHAKLPPSLSIDESSQDSARSSSSSANGSKRKIHAQRKFAQGCSLPGTPNSTPAKLAAPTVKKISSRIPKTEDFLTFLCLRGTSILPPHLDFFNYSREELSSQEVVAKSGSSNKSKRQREGTPDSSSTSSGANEEVAEAAENVRTPASAGKRGGDNSLLAKRSAARASAGTPETARGIVSLRQGLQRKVSSSSSSRSSSPRFPVASTSSLFSPCQAQQASSSSTGAVLINPVYSNPLLPPRNRRPKFYFTPEKSPSPSKASGVRPGEFTPPSMHGGSLYFGSVRNFSPLVCRPSTSKSASTASTPSSRQSAMAQGLYSSPSSYYPSSSRSSWSSTATEGTPKRHRQRTVPFSRKNAGKQSNQGAFTPFKTTSHLAGEVTPKSPHNGRHGAGSPHGASSSASRQRMSGIKMESSSLRSPDVMSARKSLLGKLTSVAQQHAKKILDRSARQREGRAERMAKRLQLKRKMEKEQEEEDDEDEEEEEKEESKDGGKTKKKYESHRREREGSQRNRDKGGKHTKEDKIKSFMSKRRSSLPRMGKSQKLWTTQERPNQNSDSSQPRSDHDMSKDKDKVGRKGRSKEGKETDKKSVQALNKPRRPYKVRPIERVRTRGYNQLLASKQAMRRAKRDDGARLKNKTDLDTLDLKEVDHKHAGQTVVENSGEDFESDREHPSKRPLDKKPYSIVGTWEKKRTPQLGEDSIPSGKKRSGSIASETESVPSRRSSKESLSSKPSAAARTARRSSSSNVQLQAACEEKSTILTFHPTDTEFSDPMAYISKIQKEAECHGMCRIIPPSSWKLDSSKLIEDVRFTSQVQSVHRLYQRWGPNVQQSAAINQHLMTGHSNITTTSPQMGGVEIDLPRLHQLVEDAGGPKKMVDKKDWTKIADLMNIPKQSPDRSDRLYDIYCYHVFPYASLSEKERRQLDSEVEAIHKSQTLEEDVIRKGRLMTLSSFSRVARNVMSMWFKEEPTPEQVETEYWKLVEEGKRHVSVQCGHINTRAQASAFPTRKDNPYSRHAWNLNNIPGSPGCMLKYLGHVAGVSIPTLHIGMLFSTSCWSSAPHGLPYIQYQHTGAPTIWHCVSKYQQYELQSALKEVVPTLVTDKPCWLREDWLMVNPKRLSQQGVLVEKCVQYPGQFVVVFPGAFTSTVSCGYSVSESVHFALPSWLPQGLEASMMLNKSEERELFCMSSILCPLVQDESVDIAILAEALPLLSSLINKELDLRNQLSASGLKGEKRDVFFDSPSSLTIVNKRRSSVTDDKVCDVCNRICYMSMVLIEHEDQVLCIEHGVKHIQKKKSNKYIKLFLRYTQNDLETMLKEAKERLNSNSSLGSSSSSGGGSSTSSGIGSTSVNSGNSTGSKKRHNSRQSLSTS